MEHIDFTYIFKGNDSTEMSVHVSKNEEKGISGNDVCELFLNFMEAIGYSRENIVKFLTD